MALTAPPAEEVSEFQFKLHCRLKIFDNEDGSVFGKPYSLITAASRYGFVFVGTSSASFQVLSLQNVEQISEKKTDVSDYLKRTINLPSRPTHLSVNCNCTLLCVVVEKESCATALIYNVASFATQNVSVIKEIRLSATPGVSAVEVSWNPTIPAVLTVCKSDKSLALYEFKGSGIEIHEIPSASGATSMCWSPKGKQLAVGSVDGKITQYKPDLKPVKAINAPQLEGGCTVLALQWVSNYQFIAVYGSTDPESRANLVVIDAPKTGETKFVNYEDVCYSYGSTRPPQFYMILQPTWNVLMVASSNSMEVGILGQSKEQQWTQWILGDAARAELPLSPKKQDTLPIGLAIDTATKSSIPWGETSLPPAPLLYLLSHHGVLCCFHIINLKEGAAQICQPQEILPEDNGLKYFTKESAEEKKQDAQKIVQAQLQTQQVQQQIHPVVQPQQQLQQQQQAHQQLQQQQAQQQLQLQQQQQLQLLQQQQQQQLQLQLLQQQQQLQMKQQQVQQQQPSQLSTTKAKDKPLFGSPTKNVFGSPQQQQQPPQQLFGTTAKNLFPAQQKTPPAVQTTPPSIKSEVKPAVTSAPTEPVPAVPKIDAETEKLISKMIREECTSLESELKALLHKAQTLNINFGSDAESTELVKNTEALQTFLEKITETSVAQAAEVHTLKQKLLQSWAWFEDARSRYAISRDPAMAALIRTQPLDPASQQHLNDITCLLYYIESQLTQANNTLDEQWENFQDSCKKTYKVQLPTMETIYQAMVRQTATVQKQGYILKDIAARLRKHDSTHTTVALLTSLQNADEVVDKLKGLRLQPQDLMQVEYERILKKQKQLSPQKVERLQEFLGEHKPRIVKIVKPQVAPLKLTPQKSILEANMSPVVSKTKELTPRVLDFVQSTPKPTQQVAAAKAWVPEAKPGIFASAFASTTQPMPLTQKPTFVATTTAVSQPSLYAGVVAKPSTTKSTFSFTPQSAAFPIDSTKFSFTTIPATASTTSTGSLFSGFKQPTAQLSTFNKTVVSSPGIIKPTAKAAVAPLPQFVVHPQDTPKAVTFLQNAQESTVATQGSIFAKPTVSFSKAFEAATQVSQAPNSMFSFTSAGKAATTAVVSVVRSPAVTATIAVSKASGAPVFAAATAGVQSQASSVTTTTPSVIFASAAPTSQPPIFAASVVPKPTPTPAVTTPTSVFVIASTPSTTTASVFGATSTTTATPLASTTSTSVVASAAPSISTPTSAVSSPTTTTTTSFFAAKQSTTAASTPSIFGVATATTSASSIFGAAATSLFGTTRPSTVSTTGAISPTTAAAATTGEVTPNKAAATTESISSIFALAQTTTATAGLSVATTTSAAALPEKAAAATTAVVSSTIATTTASVFGSTPVATSPVFGTTATTTTTGIFGAGAKVSSTAASTQSSIFGSAVPSTAAGIFGSVTSATSIFPATAATTRSIFGVAATTTTATVSSAVALTTPCIFGTTSAAATTSATIFGVAAPATTSSTFGSPTTTASIFGAATTATSLFASSPPATTSSTFGSTGTTSIFGAPAATTASIFGGGSAFSSAAFGQKPPAFGSTATSSAPAFGSAPVFASTAPAFGSPSAAQTTTFGSGSLFGSPPASTSSSIFGGTQSSGGIFGKPATTTPAFGAATTTAPAFGGSAAGFSFASAAANVPNTNTAFGFNKPAGFGGDAGSFSFGALSVGTTTTASTGFSGGFGQTQTANPFGRTETKPGFGSSSGSIFGSPAATSAGSAFGSGGTSTFGSPAFGSTPTFGASPGFGQSNFGQSGFGSSFGSQSQQPSGPFSGGGQAVAQTGFGGGAFQSSPGGFGGPPVFGSGSSPGGFGAAPAFGGAPTFGSTPAFGSPGKAFGSPTIGSSTFGSAGAQQSPTFGNLANQNTLGFGSLAQQSQTPAATQQPAFGSGSSFSSWR